jgi:uncharacterized membrane protein
MKKSALIIILTTFLTVILYLQLITSKANAQEKLPLVVAPARQQVNIDPGNTISLVTKFFNEGVSPLAGNVKVVDFIVTDSEGSPKFLYNQNLSNRFSGASWVKLSSDKIAISPGGVAKVQYSISVPKDAAPGGHYVAIYFEPVGLLGQETNQEAQNALAVIPRIASLVYIRVNGPISEMALVKKFLTPGFIQYGPVEIEAEIANRGDYHITPKGQVVLKDIFGNVISQKSLEEVNIFPDASRVYNLSLGPKLLIGKFRVELAASYGEAGMGLSAVSTLWAFPIVYLLAIVLAVMIIVLLVMFIWKKIKEKQSKLEEKLKEEISEIEILKQKYQDTISEKISQNTPKK